MNMHLTKDKLYENLTRAVGHTAVTVAFGDGIGPEIMSASLKVMLAAQARLSIEPIDIGERVYRAGDSSGISPQAWDSMRRTKVLFKAPVTTPQGGGFKSVNVTIRKALGLYANIRPCRAYAPFVKTRHPDLDLIIVRENEEDLYAGIEHRQTDEVYQCLKLISRPGTEKIVRYAFELARSRGRRKVSCFTKDNIMKLTDGLFHKVFDEIGALYPEIEKEHLIVDIGAARLADAPEQFDVVVLPNLYGDILSDVAAEIAGSVGLGASSNIGDHVAMFEAIHGSAPLIAGQNIANPSGLLLAGCAMLEHIGQGDVAAKIQNAWLRAIEDGVHTGDMYDAGHSTQHVGTDAFADAVIERLGEKPTRLKAVEKPAEAIALQTKPAAKPAPAEKKLVGFDVFLHWAGASPDQIAVRLNDLLSPAFGDALKLTMISNRGVKVWPKGMKETFCTDHWRARVEAGPGKSLNHAMQAEALRRLAVGGVDFIKTEGLYTFDGVPGFSLGQGQ